MLILLACVISSTAATTVTTTTATPAPIKGPIQCVPDATGTKNVFRVDDATRDGNDISAGIDADNEKVCFQTLHKLNGALYPLLLATGSREDFGKESSELVHCKESSMVPTIPSSTTAVTGTTQSSTTTTTATMKFKNVEFGCHNKDSGNPTLLVPSEEACDFIYGGITTKNGDVSSSLSGTCKQWRTNTWFYCNGLGESFWWPYAEQEFEERALPSDVPYMSLLLMELMGKEAWSWVGYPISSSTSFPAPFHRWNAPQLKFTSQDFTFLYHEIDHCEYTYDNLEVLFFVQGRRSRDKSLIMQSCQKVTGALNAGISKVLATTVPGYNCGDAGPPCCIPADIADGAIEIVTCNLESRQTNATLCLSNLKKSLEDANVEVPYCKYIMPTTSTTTETASTTTVTTSTVTSLPLFTLHANDCDTFLRAFQTGVLAATIECDPLVNDGELSTTPQDCEATASLLNDFIISSDVENRETHNGGADIGNEDEDPIIGVDDLGESTEQRGLFGGVVAAAVILVFLGIIAVVIWWKRKQSTNRANMTRQLKGGKKTAYKNPHFNNDAERRCRNCGLKVAQCVCRERAESIAQGNFPKLVTDEYIDVDAKGTADVYLEAVVAAAAHGAYKVVAAPSSGIYAPGAASDNSSSAAAAAASEPDYATIDESNYMVYLNAFAGGATRDIYGELAALGQIPSSGTLYATAVESNAPVYATPAEAAEAGAAVYDASRSGAMYDKASAYQLKTAYNQKYLDRQVSHLTEAQRWARLAKMAKAMAAHQGEYDALFAKWSASAWIEDLDVQHKIVVRNIAADAVVQPNPWASAEPASTLSRAGAVTSKRYLLKLLGVYNQKDEDSPVPMIAAACREIVAKLGDGAVRFVLGKTKDQGRIFEKVLANEGRFDLIRDYARATFVVKDVAAFPRLLQHLLMDETFKVVRVKNRLSRSWDSRASAGYRDYQVIVQTKEGWIMELQLIPKAMYKLKSKLGHSDYTQYRFIIEAGQRARGKGTNAIGGDQEC